MLLYGNNLKTQCMDIFNGVKSINLLNMLQNMNNCILVFPIQLHYIHFVIGHQIATQNPYYVLFSFINANNNNLRGYYSSLFTLFQKIKHKKGNRKGKLRYRSVKMIAVYACDSIRISLRTVFLLYRCHKSVCFKILNNTCIYRATQSIKLS